MSTLEQDYTTVPGQLYACLSVVGPEAPQKNDKFGIKIRGAFNSKDEAASHAKRLQKEDATFDIYVVDMYKWLLIPPDPVQIEDAHYADEKLEELMLGYRENQAQAAQMFAERKKDMMAVKAPGSDVYYKGGDENSRFYTKQDEAPISHPGEVLERLQKENPDADMEDLVKEADAIVEQEKEAVREKRELDFKNALEKEATERGFGSVEAMKKFDDEKSRSDVAAAEEANKSQIENSEDAQIKESDDTGEEEEVTSKNKENEDPEEA